MRTLHRDIVSTIIFSKDGKLLQAHKDPKSGGVYADCWHIPGGGVDNGETKERALVREIKEELGVDLSGYTPTLVDDIGRGNSIKTLPDGEQVNCEMKFYIYRVDLATNAADTKITPGDDIKEFRWTDLAELSSIKITPPSVELFKRLGYF
jgi:8-oxo-dGTP pyrophosphatase MutT (NUDIX family)